MYIPWSVYFWNTHRFHRNGRHSDGSSSSTTDQTMGRGKVGTYLLFISSEESFTLFVQSTACIECPVLCLCVCVRFIKFCSIAGPSSGRQRQRNYQYFGHKNKTYVPNSRPETVIVPFPPSGSFLLCFLGFLATREQQTNDRIQTS